MTYSPCPLCTNEEVNMSQTDLLPCPFCGNGNVKIITNTIAAMSWVACEDCGLEAPTETGTSADDAVAYWQTRREAVTGSALVYAIKGTIDRLQFEGETDTLKIARDIAALPLCNQYSHSLNKDKER